MVVDFIVAELVIWAVMMALLPIAVAILIALASRMSLPRPKADAASAGQCAITPCW